MGYSQMGIRQNLIMELLILGIKKTLEKLHQFPRKLHGRLRMTNSQPQNILLWSTHFPVVSSILNCNQ
jgi:hypothetical protein